MRSLVDSDNAFDYVTRLPRPGLLVDKENAQIYWNPKKKNIIKTSTFVSDSITIKQYCEFMRGIRCKLKMMGIPREFPTYIYADNQ